MASVAQRRSALVAQLLGAFLLGAVAWALGYLVVAIHPLAPLALVVGVAGAVLGATHPFGLLLIFLAVLLTRPHDFYPALKALQLAKLTAVGSLGLFVAGKMMRRDLSIADAPQVRWFGYLLGGVLVSVVLGTNRGFSFAFFKDVFVKIAILYLLITNLVDSPKRAVIFQTAVALCTGYLGFYAYRAKLTGTADIEGSRAAFVGILGDPNDLALTLLMSVFFCFAAWRRSRGPLRLFFFALLFLHIAGLIATQSRGGMLGLVAASYVFFKDRVKNKALVLAAVIGVGGLFLVAAGLKSRATVSSDGIDASAQGRLDAWKAAGRMFVRSPAWGVGVEMFAWQYPNYAWDAWDQRPKETHNMYLKALAETGLLGFVPFAMLLWLTWRSAGLLQVRSSRAPPDSLERAVLESQQANLTGLLVSAFFLSQCWTWFPYILVGFVTALERIYLQPAADPEEVIV
ncbi:MAG: O-antigen ligase family protein [Myxococcales bacterium]|nr:O-antigen ligase family protein [Myxococcales bacterium]